MTWLMPANLAPGSNEHTRGVIFITVLLINYLFCLLAYGWIIFGMGLEARALQMAVGIVTFILVVYTIALATLRIKQSITLSVNIMMIAILYPVLYGAWLSGGVGTSPISALILTSALLAFVLGGMKTGIFWTALALVTYGLQFYLEQTAFTPPPSLLDANSLRHFQDAIPLSATLMSVAAVMIYEHLNKRLRTALYDERHLFAFQAAHDTLTGLPNRESFHQSVQFNIEAADLSNKKLALVYMDLDGFKPVNDTHGHHAGDVVLQTVTQRLQDVIRGADTVARLGGDEFAFLFCGYESRDSLERSLRKILETVAEDIEIGGKTVVNVSASLGVAIYPDDAPTFEKLCRHADMAMYQAKKQHNTWRFFVDQARAG